VRICHCQHGCRTSESDSQEEAAAARAFGQVININAKCHVLHFSKF